MTEYGWLNRERAERPPVTNAMRADMCEMRALDAERNAALYDELNPANAQASRDFAARMRAEGEALRKQPD